MNRRVTPALWSPRTPPPIRGLGHRRGLTHGRDRGRLGGRLGAREPRRDLNQVDEQVSGLEVGDQVSVYVAVLTLYLRKLHQLAATTRPE